MLLEEGSCQTFATVSLREQALHASSPRWNEGWPQLGPPVISQRTLRAMHEAWIAYRIATGSEMRGIDLASPVQSDCSTV